MRLPVIPILQSWCVNAQMALQSCELRFQKGAMDNNGDIPTLMGKLKVDWVQLPVYDILNQFGTLKEGICRGVFRQKAAAARLGCRSEKVQITVILPSGLEVEVG